MYDYRSIHIFLLFLIISTIVLIKPLCIDYYYFNSSLIEATSSKLTQITYYITFQKPGSAMHVVKCVSDCGVCEGVE